LRAAGTNRTTRTAHMSAKPNRLIRAVALHSERIWSPDRVRILLHEANE
jgi:hypothetical protein